MSKEATAVRYWRARRSHLDEAQYEVQTRFRTRPSAAAALLHLRGETSTTYHVKGGETEGECGENSKRPWIHVAERIPKREDIHTLILPRAARGIQMTRDDGCEISHDRLRCCCLLLAAGGDCNEKAWGATTERYSSSEVLFWMN